MKEKAENAIYRSVSVHHVALTSCVTRLSVSDR